MSYIKWAVGIGIVALAVWVAVGGINMLFEEQDDDYQTQVYGVSNIGAETIEFRAGDGATGGYTIHSFAGNTIYAPTEWKNSQTSSSAYTQISKSGYVLMGWSTSGPDGAISLYPGQAWQVQANSAHKTTFYAVWMEQNRANLGLETIQTNSTFTKQYTSDTSDPWYGLVYGWAEFCSRSSLKMTVERNGYTEVRTLSSGNGVDGVLSANGVTFTITHNDYWEGIQHRYNYYWDLSARFDTPGVAKVTFDVEGESVFSGFVLTISAYDSSTDPSNIYYITHSQYVNSSRSNFQNNSGPTGTAIVLPDRVAAYGSQDGWNAEREGQPAYVPLGGTYVITHNYNLTPYSVTYQQALSKIAIVAYNANGGDYTGRIAHAAERGNYTTLSNNIVTKPGYYFLGWNLTGNEGDPIYTGGYQYYVGTNDSNQGEYYIEFKAVWSATNPTTQITCRGLSGDERYNTLNTAVNHSYYLPVTGFDVSGYDFMGWAIVQYEIGTGTATVSNPVTVTGGMTLYPVYKKTVYTCVIKYDKNGGQGSMSDKVVHPESLPATIQLDTCRFVKDGSTFIGWSEDPNATTPTVGTTWTFIRSGEIRLYAVWSESSSGENNNLFVVIYNGNGTNVSNIVIPTYSRTTPENEKSITVTIPSWEPVRQGYAFMGWSTTPDGEVQYRNNGETPTPDNTETTAIWNRFTMTLTGSDTYISTTLYAIWEPTGSGPVVPTEKVNVTYMKDDVIVKTLKVDKGSTAIYYSPESVEGRSFFGWYNGTDRWNFSKPIYSDLVLKANYVKVFTIQVEDKSVKVILDPNIDAGAGAIVKFSDGFEETYYTQTIPAHEVDRDGTVTVTIETESGTHTAQCSYKITEKSSSSDNESNGGDDDGKDKSESFPIDTTVAIVGGVVGIIAIIALVGRFLI